MRITKDKCVALFIDYQERLVPAMKDGDDFVKNSAILAKGLIALDVPIIVSEQYPKGLGTTVSEIKDIEGFPEAFAKTTFSCIDTTEIFDAIKATGKKTVIVCGCETHVCVLQSVIDLIAKEYNVLLIADCITSRKESDKKYGIKRAIQEGAYTGTYESVLFELQREAKGDSFKTISALVK